MKLWQVAALSVCSFGTAVWASGLETTNRYGAAYVTYAQVDRVDGSYRRMLTTPDVLEAVQAGRPIPDGARILMETYHRRDVLGTVFHKQRVNGRWHYGSFNGQEEVRLETRPQASCLSCHATASETDFTFTKPAMAIAQHLGEVRISCDRGGRRPCALNTYLTARTE